MTGIDGQRRENRKDFTFEKRIDADTVFSRKVMIPNELDSALSERRQHLAMQAALLPSDQLAYSHLYCIER